MMNDIFYNIIVPLLLKDDCHELTNVNRRSLRLVNKRTLHAVNINTWVPNVHFLDFYPRHANDTIFGCIAQSSVKFNPQTWCVYFLYQHDTCNFAAFVACAVGKVRTCHFIYTDHHHIKVGQEPENLSIHKDSEHFNFISNGDAVVCQNINNRRMIRALKQHNGIVISVQTSLATKKLEFEGEKRVLLVVPTIPSPLSVRSTQHVQSLLWYDNKIMFC